MSDNEEATTTADAGDAGEPSAEDYQAAAAAWESVFSQQQAESSGGEQQAADDPGDNTDDEQSDDDRGNGEAARYRRRLRDTEAERDALRQRVEAMQRGEVERLAADKLADASDVWRDGAQLADVLDDNGNVDPKKVDDLTTGLLQSHKHWSRFTQPPARLRSGASGNMRTRPRGWADAIRSGE